MPLLRRNSSKQDGQSAASASGDREKKTSFFGRLSRKGSSSTDVQTVDTASGHKDAPSSDSAGPESSNSAQNAAALGQYHSQGADGALADQSAEASTPSRSSSRDSRRRHSHHRHSGSRDRSASVRDDPSLKNDESEQPKFESAVVEDNVDGGLSKDDVHHLFYGAPHFMLEKGRRGRYFPQSFFPWNTHLEVTDLQDRQYLKHESFALATMHAHLPVPDEVNWKPGMTHPVKKEGLDTGKRPMFDLGIYERPNMLGLTAREPGTVGFRFFLEIPVADGLQDEKKEHSQATELEAIQHMSASEAFKALSHEDGNAKIGKHAPYQDRTQLLKGGPKAWKAVGVRHISMQALTDRLEYICALRDEVVNAGWRVTILNKISEADLGDHLFSHLLYPPGKLVDGHKEGSLKVQIEALVKVLTTPGAWLDFSLPPERLLFGQVLYTREHNLLDKNGVKQGAKRKWALVQLLLAVELVIRMDAALREGVARHAPGLEITSEEIHHFNKLRNLKSDWDFVVARRFLDLCYLKKLRKIEGGLSSELKDEQRQSEHHFLSRFKSAVKVEDTVDDEDECAILPRQPMVMLNGLLAFARDIGWLRVDEIEKTLKSKLDTSEAEREKMLAKGVEPIEHPHVAQNHIDDACVELRAASADTVGGPLSHTWFSSLLIPGYTACDLLISTLLENDPAALSKLGPLAHIRGGFILDGQSWWSKLCIVALVMGPKAAGRERMGWLGLPHDLRPVDEHGHAYGDGWKVIKTQPAPRLRKGERIFDGELLGKESSPLGIGHGKVSSSEFSMVTDQILDNLQPFYAKDAHVILTKIPDESKQEMHEASVHFTTSTTNSNSAEPPQQNIMTFRLVYKVRFVAGHPCRLGHGHVQNQTDANRQRLQHHAHDHDRLPAHPLHKSYKYLARAISDILDAELMNPTDDASPVWIVDARGAVEREMLVRAWCAQVGRDAVIARIGVNCLSCVIREAKALQIGVIIRVGDGSR